MELYMFSWLYKWSWIGHFDSYFHSEFPGRIDQSSSFLWPSMSLQFAHNSKRRFRISKYIYYTFDFLSYIHSPIPLSSTPIKVCLLFNIPLPWFWFSLNVNSVIFYLVHIVIAGLTNHIYFWGKRWVKEQLIMRLRNFRLPVWIRGSFHLCQGDQLLHILGMILSLVSHILFTQCS